MQTTDTQRPSGLGRSNVLGNLKRPHPTSPQRVVYIGNSRLKLGIEMNSNYAARGFMEMLTFLLT